MDAFDAIRLDRAARLTHGRHCPCSACARQDWTNPTLGPCGMHGPSCPAEYAPIDAPLGYEPLAERPGYNAKPTDWVRHVAHLEQAIADTRTDITEALDAIDAYAARDLDHELHGIVEHYRGALGVRV